MKKLTLVLFLLISTLTIAQTIDNPPKKTWKILIKNSNNKEDIEEIMYWLIMNWRVINRLEMAEKIVIEDHEKEKKQ